jgi:hypothetical protein
MIARPLTGSRWYTPYALHNVTLTSALLTALLAAQGFHSVEHVVQLIQFHVLQWQASASTGLISAANAEWIHFVWNWTVVAVLLVLVRGGLRNAWAILLVAWAVAHGLEHAYLLVQYLHVQQELARLGFASLPAQGLPGVLGHDGWLARSGATQDTFLCTLPGLTTAPRLDIHFWWNAGETALLLMAATRSAKPKHVN